MDQVKIGNYIAEKRKALGMTQMQLAEKLGMSDKSVSKWERGVCLPDVSVYESLCNNLGISINEFLAGEDLKDNEIIGQSEKNIISILRDSKMRRIWGRKIIVALLVLILLLSTIVLWLLNSEGYFNKNYVRSYNSDSEEYQTVSKFISDDMELFHFYVDRHFKKAEVNIYEYREGKKEPESLLGTSLDTDEYKEGSISIIRDSINNTFKINMGNYDTMISTEVDADADRIGDAMASSHIDEISDIKADTEYPICAYVFNKNEVESIMPSEIYPNPRPRFPKGSYCVVATVKFSKEYSKYE